jgi:putative ABC transport system permease protein
MDEEFDRLYKSEIRIVKVIGYFTGLAIFIACLGLFGLSAFMSEQRRKEIGIRKVLGASITNVVLMLSKDFVKWVIIANVLAWPAAYYAMNNWLQDFAYKVDITIYVMVLSGLLAVFIALLTVSWQAFRAARTNPVNTIRYE